MAFFCDLNTSPETLPLASLGHFSKAYFGLLSWSANTCDNSLCNELFSIRPFTNRINLRKWAPDKHLCIGASRLWWRFRFALFSIFTSLLPDSIYFPNTKRQMARAPTRKLHPKCRNKTGPHAASRARIITRKIVLLSRNFTNFGRRCFFGGKAVKIFWLLGNLHSEGGNFMSAILGKSSFKIAHCRPIFLSKHGS